jgi:hypothetical protein
LYGGDPSRHRTNDARTVSPTNVTLQQKNGSSTSNSKDEKEGSNHDTITSKSPLQPQTASPITSTTIRKGSSSPTQTSTSNRRRTSSILNVSNSPHDNDNNQNQNHSFSDSSEEVSSFHEIVESRSQDLYSSTNPPANASGNVPIRSKLRDAANNRKHRNRDNSNDDGTSSEGNMGGGGYEMTEF